MVYLFALFHDCKRENDHRDLEHGPRAERYLRSIRDWVDLSDERFENLCLACATHTLGTKAKNVTVATCWDSDRLEIGQVGFIPDEKFMSTEEAKRIAREDDFEVLENFEYSGIIRRRLPKFLDPFAVGNRTESPSSSRFQSIHSRFSADPSKNPWSEVRWMDSRIPPAQWFVSAGHQRAFAEVPVFRFPR